MQVGPGCGDSKVDMANGILRLGGCLLRMVQARICKGWAAGTACLQDAKQSAVDAAHPLPTLRPAMVVGGGEGDAHNVPEGRRA